MILYHICREQDKGNLSVGYLGVTARNVNRRCIEHRCVGNRYLRNAYAKYDDIIEYEVVRGEADSILLLEVIWRPADKIGWNLVKGGGYPPQGLNKGKVFGEPTNTHKAKIAEGVSKAKGFTYLVRNPEGVDYEVGNMNKFCKEHSLTSATMYAMCKGRHRSHKGWTFVGINYSS